MEEMREIWKRWRGEPRSSRSGSLLGWRRGRPEEAAAQQPGPAAAAIDPAARAAGGGGCGVASPSSRGVRSPSFNYTHFISLPLSIHPQLVEKLYNFQNDVLRDANSSNATSHSNSDTGIDKSMFTRPKTVHITVLMLNLWNKDRIAAAIEVLQKTLSKVNCALNNRPVSVSLKGMACMGGSPASAHVLYAPVEEIGGKGRLLRACRVLIEAFAEAGLHEKDDRQTLKFHATLMNARFRKSRKNDPFDARGIFRRYGSERWGDYLIREAHLSQRFAFDESGYFHCCSSIRFPEKTRKLNDKP